MEVLPRILPLEVGMTSLGTKSVRDFAVRAFCTTSSEKIIVNRERSLYDEEI